MSLTGNLLNNFEQQEKGQVKKDKVKQWYPRLKEYRYLLVHTNKSERVSWSGDDGSVWFNLKEDLVTGLELKNDSPVEAAKLFDGSDLIQTVLVNGHRTGKKFLRWSIANKNILPALKFVY